MSTLTDRYIWAVIRSVPEQQRDDLERELRASIGDDIEARTSEGEDAAAAEREALTALGDPDRLAASYADRPSWLIGPRFYFTYVRLLKLLYAIVLPCVLVAFALAQTIAGEGVGAVLGGAVVVTMMVAVHLGFWTTLVFAILERADVPSSPPSGWELDALPERPTGNRVGLGVLIPSVVFLLVFAGAIVWQQFSSVFTDAAGDPVPLLQPELWGFWIPYLFVLIALELVFAVVLYRLGRWSWPMAAVNLLLNVAFAVPAVWLTLDDRVFNPAFLERVGWPAVVSPTVIAPVMVVVFLGIAVWDAVDGLLKARRASIAA